MKKQIWKYELSITDVQRIEMPIGAEILTSQLQGDVPVLWVMVDPTITTKEYRLIEVLGTGNPIKSGNRRYISTFQRGGFVGHVFEYLVS